MNLDEIDYVHIVENFIGQLLSYGPRLIAALVVFEIGWWIIRLIRNLMQASMDKGNLDASLKLFMLRLITIVLRVLLVISVASMIGIETTSFIAMLGATGLAVGLALHGSLANFAGGVLILVFRPFKVGDFIEAQDH